MFCKNYQSFDVLQMLTEMMSRKWNESKTYKKDSFFSSKMLGTRYGSVGNRFL